LNLFDMHADTITECYCARADLADGDFSVTLARADGIKRWRQFFAVFLNDAIEQPYECARRRIAYASDMFARMSARIAWNGEDFPAGSSPWAAALSVENGRALEGKVECVDEFARLGVRMMTLTWNAENELASGCRAPVDNGLSAFGLDAVHAMEAAGMAVDISHLADRGVADVLRLARRPVVASHSCARAVCEHPRNLTDEQLCAVWATGGIVGLALVPVFLTAGEPSFESIFLQVAHFLSLDGGAGGLAMGADFDGAEMPPLWDGIDKMPALAEYLRHRGLTAKEVDAVFFGNAQNFWSQTRTVNEFATAALTMS